MALPIIFNCIIINTNELCNILWWLCPCSLNSNQTKWSYKANYQYVQLSNANLFSVFKPFLFLFCSCFVQNHAHTSNCCSCMFPDGLVHCVKPNQPKSERNWPFLPSQTESSQIYRCDSIPGGSLYNVWNLNNTKDNHPLLKNICLKIC